MSGPIIRKYGFANFDKIFGERELKHGAADEPEPETTPTDASKPAEPQAGQVLENAPGRGRENTGQGELTDSGLIPFAETGGISYPGDLSGMTLRRMPEGRSIDIVRRFLKSTLV